MTTVPETREPRPLIGLALGVLAVFFAGGTVGAASAAFEHGGEHVWVWVVVAAMAALCIACIVGAFRFGQFAVPRTGTRTGRAQAMLWLSLAAGVGIGIALPFDQVWPIFTAPESGFAPEPWATWRTVVALAAMVVLVPVIAIVWHRNIDEHEERAYGFGATIGIYTYVTLTSTWWVGWRGGLTVQPDGYIVFWVTMLAWAFGWAWRRYR